MQQIVKSVALVYYGLPKPHRFMLAALTGITLIVTLWKPSYLPHDEEADHAITLFNRPAAITPEYGEPLDDASTHETLPQDELDQKVGPGEYIVSDGDTLSSILTQYGIEMADVALIAKRYRALRNLKIGQQLSWTLNDQGALQTLTWVVSRRETRDYQRTKNQFIENIQTQEGEWKDAVITGKINGSFVSSARAAGLNNSEIQAITSALQWQVDLRKLTKGDQFVALFSREYLEGKREQSQLTGVRLRSGSKNYYAIQANDGKFYDKTAAGLARGFMRYPTMKQFRVSSHFSPRRLNPVTGRVAPHLGVDFPMPVGTPILAVGDGEVVVAKRGASEGIHVVIRHGRQYTTRYMHLKKLLVRPGQKIKRGDRIGLSGNTGRSTGPHLHYELWVNNQAVNPLTAKLPRSDSLTGKERKEYLALVKEVTPQLLFDD